MTLMCVCVCVPCGSMCVEEREQVGRLCKLLIDLGRVHYLRQRGLEASLSYYTTPDVSLENVLLTAVPRLSHTRAPSRQRITAQADIVISEHSVNAE